MQRRWHRNHGLAEIVGTLMLVLIVVAAVTAFSFFVASYQQQLQSQENATHQRNLEAMRVLSVQTAPVSGGNPTFANMSFTIGSGDVNAMQLTDLVVNGNVVVSYNATWLENNTQVQVGIEPGDASTSLEIPALGQVVITLQLDPTAPMLSFLSGTDIPTSHSYLTLYLQTQRGSGFTFTYVPPTALADVSFVQSLVGGNLVEIPVLDGTHSLQEGGNATIVAWTWAVTNESALPAPTEWSESGAEVELGNLTDPSDRYAATLTVQNSLGLFGVSVPISF
jgi:flagellin-like protein